MSGRLGYWLDYDHAYRTMDAPYIESVWWSLKTFFDRGLLEKGHYVLPYCPRCETPLASHEVAQGHREATDPSVTVRFPLADAARPRDLLVWTTTPWTLPANLLVAVRADLEYSVVADDEGQEFVLASAALARYFPGDPRIVERVLGRELAGEGYGPPFDSAGPGPGPLPDRPGRLRHCGRRHGPRPRRARASDRTTSGSAPGRRSGSSTRWTVGAYFGDAVPQVRGKFFKTADPILMKDLAARGRLFRAETVRHTYPFCWRCDTPLLYRAIDSWFVRTSRFTDALVENNATVQWIPAHLRDGRFGNFLTEAKDWAVSRNRYWGTPLPIWMCPERHATCVGSFAELASLNGSPLPEPFDPHRVQADRIVFPCPHCGQLSRREPYTIDALVRQRLGAVRPVPLPVRTERRSTPEPRSTTWPRGSTRPAAGSTRCWSCRPPSSVGPRTGPP